MIDNKVVCISKTHLDDKCKKKIDLVRSVQSLYTFFLAD